jgi:hypothetical protein
MQRLGEILIAKGVLSLAELHTALETCHRTGGRLGTQLLEFGYVDESMLLGALSKQLGVPSVSRVKLLHSPLEVRKLLPTDIGRRLQAVPFQTVGDQVKVAMTNPNDRAAADEIAGALGRRVLPHVAAENAVMDALAGTESNDSVWSPQIDRPTVNARRSGDIEGWNRLWEPPSFRPAALFRSTRRTQIEHDVLVASFPDLEVVADGPAGALQPDVTDENYSELLRAADHRDEVGAVLARYLATLFDRVCLFSVHRGLVAGWLARGRSVVLEDLQSFAVAEERPSVFADARHSDSYVGALLDNRANAELVRALADPAPAEVAVIPIRVKQRVVAFALCDNPGGSIDQDHLDVAVRACQKAGVAFEVMILRTKLLA